ncbi:MAG: propionyl-CoA synthetase [Kordiimonas sp.]|nr:propionyl-CoA synthetase [Kordiimonas sp.]
MPGNNQKSGYFDAYEHAHRDPETFWAEQAEKVHWFKKWDRVLDNDNPPFSRWFVGGQTNTCYNCLDRHVEQGRGEQNALIYDSPVTGQIRHYNYRELRDQVALFAGALVELGITKGDRVILYMPMIPEALIAMLACARIGAIHSVVFGGFAAHELVKRIDHAQAKLIISASCGIENTRVIPYKPLLDEAIDMAETPPEHTIILQRPDHYMAELHPGRDILWEDALDRAQPADCVVLEATDPLYILYTSGTTGHPKGVIRDHGGHMVAMNWTMENVYGVTPGEVYWAASDIGWVVGHSYIIYAPLLAGCTTVMFEGKPVGTPDAGTFWRVISDHKVAVMFTAPTALRAIKQQDPDGDFIKKYDLSHFRAQFLAGERADPPTVKWAEEHLKVPVIDHWWQTETAWTVAGNYMGLGLLDFKYGSPGLPAPGYDIHILDEAGHDLPPGKTGAIVIKQPLPPGTLQSLWRNDEGYVEKYYTEFPGYYQTGDAGHMDEDGYVYVMGRTDDIINVAGHRLSTGAMEEELAGLPEVAECCVFGVDDKLKGQIPIGFLVLKAGIDRDHNEIVQEAIQCIRHNIGPVAAFKTAAIVKRLPKTRSGKILRGTLQKIANGSDWKMPATIDDPATLDEVSETLKTLGFPV